VFWKGRSFPIAWSFGIGISHSPIYLLAFDFSGLEAISWEAEFVVVPTARKAHLAREGSTYSLGSWVSSVFSLEDS
jgi:hypothetical protein